MESDVLHVMGPYQERIPARAPSKKVVSDQNFDQREPNCTCNKGVVHAPRVLDYETQVVAPGEPDSFLDVLRSSCIDTNYRHASLLTRNPERGVEVATLDRPVGKGVRFVVCEFSGTSISKTRKLLWASVTLWRSIATDIYPPLSVVLWASSGLL